MMTDKLPRFNVPNGNAVFSPEGRLVRYSDHAATVERLTRERDLLWREHQKAGHECADLLAALTASEARVAEMEEALRKALEFINSASGSALGLAMSTDHPCPDTVLMDIATDGMGLGGDIAAALASGEKR